MGQRVYGVSRVFLNGVDYRTKPGSTLELGGRAYTAQYAHGAFAGFSWSPIVARLVCRFEMMSDTDIRALHTGFNESNGDLGGQVEVVTDLGGGTFYFLPAKIIEPPRVSDGGGGVECTIEGATSDYLGPDGIPGAAGAVAGLL